MGNKISRRRQVVDERYTRPQGLYHHKNIDHKKLRKLILESKLAPCYPGDDDCALDLEECPICFMYYPSLNRSRCCTKSICTECFLQMKPAHASRPTQCPFCKTPNYAVEYHGVKTKEEKGKEQVEEQKVIEAQIRIRHKELQDEAEETKKRQNVSSSNRIMSPLEAEYEDTYVPIRTQNGAFPSQASCFGPANMRLWHSRQNRNENFDPDLEDFTLMEAVWLSVQEQGNLLAPIPSGNFLPGPSYSDECCNSHGIIPVKPSPGLACAAVALAEHRQTNGETGYFIGGNHETANMVPSNSPTFDILQPADIFTGGYMRFVQNNPTGHWTEISPIGGWGVVREEYGECSNGHWSTQTEGSTSYTGSDVLVDAYVGITPMLDGGVMAPGHFVQENVEEQMMLAMTVSLAEARARMSNQGFGWMQQ